MLRSAGEAVPALAGQLAAKGCGGVDAVGPDLRADPPGPGIRVIDLALVSASLSASPELPAIVVRLRATWPHVPLVCLPGAAPAPGLPTLSRTLSLSELCERLDEIVMAAAQTRAESQRLRHAGEGLAARVREARLALALADVVPDTRRLLVEARHLTAKGRAGGERS
ncbi:MULTISPECIES: hypothetical protein [Methylobacterium]|uniref:hypothetical protein n=1 Tax=Methylobacterium TaxID=407 RepID=UPI0013EA0DD5|nr:hypothetical protein [Methylobacterium sp. DB0501]NGM33452.1 hypothetical protein [Methylobacterium sp. DB0501]